MGARSGGGGGFNDPLSFKQRTLKQRLITNGMKQSQADSAVRLFAGEINSGLPLPKSLQV